MPAVLQADTTNAALEAVIRGIRDKAIRLADQLAQDLLLVGGPLPRHTDFSLEKEREVRKVLLPMMLDLPDKDKEPVLLAFTARHGPALVMRICTYSREKQPIALSAYVQVLALLPILEENAYLRALLRMPCAKGLPNAVALHLTRGIYWYMSDGPGHVCALLADMMIWCDERMGDDGRAPVDAALRRELLVVVPPLQMHFQRKERKVADIATQRLDVLLRRIECGGPGDNFLTLTRMRLQASFAGEIGCFKCKEPTDLLCSQCQVVRFCSKKCQSEVWIAKHGAQCFPLD